MTGHKRAAPTLSVMIVLVLAGFFLRTYHLTTVPLRGDEAFSVQYWAGQPLAVSLTQTATIEPHPALTYAVFRLWGLSAGLTDFSMRMLPALAGLIGIPAIFAVGKRLANRQIGLLAALFFALHPYEIWHAQDVRNYAIWASLSLIALWLGLRALDRQNKRDWLYYALAASLANNMFYTEVLMVAAFGVYVLLVYGRKPHILIRWGVCAAIAGGTSLASFLILQAPLFARGGYGGSIGGPLDISKLWSHFLPALSFGETTLPASMLTALWPFVALALLAGLALLWHWRRRTALALLLLGVIPPLLLAMASTRLDIFTPRYVLAVTPVYLLIFAGALVMLHRRIPVVPATVVITVLLTGWVAISGFSLSNHYFDPVYAKARGWPSLARYLHQNAQPGDLILQSAADAAFGYYYHQTAQPVPPDIPLPETPAQPSAGIETRLAAYSQQHSAIWQVGQEFPDWPNAGVVRNWLENHMQLVLEGEAGGLPLRQYKPWQVTPDDLRQPVETTFASTVTLLAYRLLPAPSPDGKLTVWLYWQPLQNTPAPLKVFVHLLGPINPATGSALWTQDDRFPQNGRISSVNWDADTIYRDVYTLPLADLPAGTYTLEVGLYNPDTNQRLTVGEADSLVLQTLERP